MSICDLMSFSNVAGYNHCFVMLYYVCASFSEFLLNYNDIIIYLFDCINIDL